MDNNSSVEATAREIARFYGYKGMEADYQTFVDGSRAIISRHCSPVGDAATSPAQATEAASFDDWFNREDYGDREQLQRAFIAGSESTRTAIVRLVREWGHDWEMRSSIADEIKSIPLDELLANSLEALDKRINANVARMEESQKVSQSELDELMKGGE